MARYLRIKLKFSTQTADGSRNEQRDVQQRLEETGCGRKSNANEPARL